MASNNIILEDLKQIIGEPIEWSRFSGKTILISGANGFLPAYMIETLLALLDKGTISNTKIIALVRNIEKAKTRFSDYIGNQSLDFLIQDVCDPIKTDKDVHFIIHAASQASPKFYGIDPIGTLSANTLGTINLLKFAQQKSIESFLFFSSGEVYGRVENSNMPIKETDFGYLDPTHVRSCYAESKRMGETICKAWLHQHGIPVRIVRPFHIYGPGFSLGDGRVFADFIADIINKRDIVMKSDGFVFRSFCYLADATIAFFLTLLNGQIGGAYNVGNPEQEIRIIDLALQLASLFPEREIKVIKTNKQAHGYIKSEVIRNSPDISRMKDLGWYPKVDLKNGFYKTIMSYETDDHNKQSFDP